jgi:hypothetical protein
MARTWRPTGGWRLAVPAVAAVAVLAAVIVGGNGDGDGGPRTTSTTAPPPVVLPPEHLLEAYERSRRARWLVEYDFSRRLSNGAEVDMTVVEVNVPPDRVRVGLGGVDGRVDGRQVLCGEHEGRRLCGPGGPAVPFEEQLAIDLGELGDVLRPPQNVYEVLRGDPRTVLGEALDCYVLRRVAFFPAPPYGERAEFCYGADGAPLLNRIERLEGTDEQVATSVRRDVSRADIDELLASR